MFDISTLTQEQQWGLANAVRKANLAIRSANESKADEDKTTEWTLQAYADFVIASLFDGYWEQCRLDGLNEQIIPKVMTLDLPTEFSLRAQLKIPNLIPDEYLEQLPQ